LDELGLPYSIWIDDVQRLIEQERAGAPRAWFDDYHAYADIVGYLNQLATDHPALAQVFPVGPLSRSDNLGLRIASPDLRRPRRRRVLWCRPRARVDRDHVPQHVATHLLTQYGPIRS